MRELKLAPDYPLPLDHGPAGRGIELDSPDIAFGTMEAVQPRLVAARWSEITSFEYRYLLAFWRQETGEGAAPFLLSLPVQAGADVQFRAMFVGDITASNFTATTATLAAQLALLPVANIYPLSAAEQAKLAQITTEV